ncbi:c-type cytochrome [Paracoccus jeotgali]|uniref:c-type cytochrome n=1 Tax=Paracoccus jeotgali TaxID=2065379 RepID=UPI0028B145B9|nr:cytochrome c [Paracoccus jeotgali]
MVTFLRILGLLVILAVVAVIGLIFWPLNTTEADRITLAPEVMAWPDVPAEDYPRLATIAADCSACHTADDGEPFAGGRAFPTPMGVIYAANITPDPETGIGDYSLDQFRAALVDGIRADGAHLYPAMPYASFRKLAERDVEAIYRYLMDDVQPVNAPEREAQMTFPFNMRFGVRAWKWLALPTPGFQPPDDPVLARGAYLVEGPEHCGACHTERNIFYIEKGYSAADADYLMGGDLNGWPAPALRGPDGAPARWSAENLRAYLQDGRNDHNATAGEMTLVTEHSLQHLPDSDINAIVSYLRHLAPNGGGEEPAPLPDTTAERMWNAAAEGETAALLSSADPSALDLGARLYLDNCSACHLIDGKGAPRVIPELDANPVVTSDATEGLLQMILHGDTMPSTAGAPLKLAMPGFADRLNDEEIAALASFVRTAWSNAASPITAEAVSESRGE